MEKHSSFADMIHAFLVCIVLLLWLLTSEYELHASVSWLQILISVLVCLFALYMMILHARHERKHEEASSRKRS